MGSRADEMIDALNDTYGKGSLDDLLRQYWEDEGETQKLNSGDDLRDHYSASDGESLANAELDFWKAKNAS